MNLENTTLKEEKKEDRLSEAEAFDMVKMMSSVLYEERLKELRKDKNGFYTVAHGQALDRLEREPSSDEYEQTFKTVGYIVDRAKNETNKEKLKNDLKRAMQDLGYLPLIVLSGIMDVIGTPIEIIIDGPGGGENSRFLPIILKKMKEGRKDIADVGTDLHDLRDQADQTKRNRRDISQY